MPAEPATREGALGALQVAARRFAETRRIGTRFRTRELVALLMAHGARSWRASLPPANLRLQVVGPRGQVAVKLRLP